ncbi:hypothetical protein ID866_1065, partial [Astraeus odoratus]
MTGLVDSSPYPRHRAKTASPHNNGGGMWRTSCEGLTNSQLHYSHPLKSAGDAFCEKPYRYTVPNQLRVGSDSTNHWPVLSDTARVVISDPPSRRVES